MSADISAVLANLNAPSPSLSEAENGLMGPVILIVSALIRRSGNATFKAKLGLSPIEWAIIARIGKDGPMTQTQLAELGLLDKGQLCRTVSQLANKKLIVRDSSGPRRFQLRLAAAGSKAYAIISRISVARHAALCRGIGRRDLHDFFRVLDKVAFNASMLLESVRSEVNENT